MTKKIFILLCALVLSIGMVACNSGSEDSNNKNKEEEKSPEAITSDGGVIEVTPVNEPYAVDVYRGSDVINLWLGDSDSKESGKDFVKIDATGKDGKDQAGVLVCKSYVQGEEYTFKQLEEDLDKHIADSPNIYSNPEQVTIKEIEYIKCDVKINGYPSYVYFGVVDGKPVTISVCGEDIKDSDELTQILESIVYNY